MQTIARISHVFATGYILMFYSENLFWARVKPEDNLLEWIMTWGVYSILAFVFIILVTQFKISTITGVFLCGAVFGWLAEGLIVQTMYEDLPLSISFTGLGWHALISVCIGWYFLRKVLHQSSRHTAITASLIGICYGFWAISWWTEPGGIKQNPLGFFFYSISITILVVMAYWLADRTSHVRIHPGKITYIILSTIISILFLFVVIPAVGIYSILLPILLTIVVLALKAKGKSQSKLTQNLIPEEHPPVVRYLWILMIPVFSSLIYYLVYAIHLEMHTNWVLYLIVTPLGFVFLIYSLYKHFFVKGKSKMGQSAN